MSNRSVKLLRIWICGLGALRRYHLKIFCYLELLATFIVWRSGTIYAILVEVITGNNSVKLFLIWTSGSGDVI